MLTAVLPGITAKSRFQIFSCTERKSGGGAQFNNRGWLSQNEKQVVNFCLYNSIGSVSNKFDNRGCRSTINRIPVLLMPAIFLPAGLWHPFTTTRICISQDISLTTF
jgi:hypothetical protein